MILASLALSKSFFAMVVMTSAHGVFHSSRCWMMPPAFSSAAEAMAAAFFRINGGDTVVDFYINITINGTRNILSPSFFHPAADGGLVDAVLSESLPMLAPTSYYARMFSQSYRCFRMFTP